MSNGTTFTAWKDKLLFWGVTTILAGGIGWASWVTIQINNVPSRNEVENLIKSRAPYVEDRALIMRSLDRNDESLKSITNVIDRNTEAINQLRIELAKRGSCNP